MKTGKQELVDQINSFGLLDPNYDGEGANAANPTSIEDCISFLVLLPEWVPEPEAGILAEGDVEVYWLDEELRAILHFPGDGRIVYFMIINGIRHKGITTFNKLRR